MLLNRYWEVCQRTNCGGVARYVPRIRSYTPTANGPRSATFCRQCIEELAIMLQADGYDCLVHDLQTDDWFVVKATDTRS